MPRQQFDRVTGAYPQHEEHDDHLISDHYNEALYDYSLGNGVQMRRPMDHGFPGRQESLSSERRGEHFGKGPKDWKRADERIYEEVCDSLTHNHLVDASEIEVTVDEGIVHLRGSVEDRPTKREAEKCAERVAGVRDVFNELKLKSIHLF